MTDGTRVAPARRGPAWLGSGRTRRWLLAGYVSLLAVLAFPILASPIAGDDLHWIMETTPRTKGTWEGWLRWTVTHPWAPSPETGRFAQSAYVVQRVADHVTWMISMTLQVSPVVVRVVLKMALLGALVVSLRSMLTRFRVATPAGPHALSAAPRRVMLVVFPLVVLLGAKAASLSGRDSNGWIDYPLLTLTGAALCFGAVAVVTRTIDAWPSWGVVRRVLVQVIAVLSAAVLVTSYELFYLVVPVVLVAGAVHADGVRRFSRPWWTARGGVLGAFTVAFVAGVAATRWYAAQVCADSSCYSGITVEAGPEALRTVAYNLLSSLPGGIRDEVAATAQHNGVIVPQGLTQTALGVVLGVAVVALAVVLALALTPEVRHRASAAHSADAERGDRAVLLWMVVFGLGVGAAAAVLTSLNARAQAEIETVGVAFRSGPMVWMLFSLAVTAALLLVLAAVRRSRGLSRGVVLLAAVAVTGLVAISWPINLDARRSELAYPLIDVVAQMHDAIITPVPGEAGDAARCELLSRMYEMKDYRALVRLAQGSHDSFTYFHGAPFCSAKVDEWKEPYVHEVPTDVSP